jgi:lysozyme
MKLARVGLVLSAATYLACAAKSGESTGSARSGVSQCAAGSTVSGLDVSHYDGSVDWSQVSGAGMTFAFAKATEGTSDVDSEFATNWPAMQQAGVIRGAYHFFHPEEDATTQANFVANTVGSLGTNDLPIVCDFEELNGVAEATAVADAVTFLSDVTQMTGKTAILYMSSDFLSGTYSSLAPYPLWVANYGVSCPGVPAPYTTWDFWQYGDTGSVNGISDQCDTDYFNGTLQQLTGSSSGSSSGGGSTSSSCGGSSGGSSSGGSSGGGSSSSGSGSSGGSSGGGGSTSGSGGSGSGSGGASSSGSGGGNTSSGSTSSGGSSGGTTSSSGGASGSSGGGSTGTSNGSGMANAGAGDAGNGGSGNDNVNPPTSGGGGCSVSHAPSRDESTVLLMGGALLVLAGIRRRRRVV